MRWYTKAIKYCIECGESSSDVSFNKLVCKKEHNRHICWLDGFEDTEPIPEWCRLEKVKE